MKKIFLTLLQLAVTGGLLYWVFHDPATRAAMLHALRVADYRWVLAGIFAYCMVELAAGVRWNILLKVQGIRLTTPRVSGLFLIGMFYNQFLPGGTGGDLIKTYLLWKETPDKKSGALLAVMFDRMIGLMALIVITGTLIFMRFHWLTRETGTRLDNNPLHDPKFYVWVVLLVFGSSVLFVVTTFVVSGFNLFHWLPQRFPGREKLIEVAAAYHLYAHHWRATAAAFVASLVAHLSTFATFLCVAHAFRGSSGVGLIDFFSIMPIERTISSLPISFAGVGTREFVLQVMLFNLCGVPPADARLIGLTSFAIIFICCLPGGLVYFLYRPSGATGHVKMSEMREEVATVEHEVGESQ